VFAEAMLKVDRLSGQGDRVLAQIADAERFAGTLMEGGDDLVAAARSATMEAAAARAAIDATRPTAELLAERAQPMIDAAVAAREQLRETQAVLEEANERFGRALEMAEPIDRMTARAARIAGTLRRDPSD
jgi:ABC-type transporter Mla subunit MlaD